MDVHVVNKVGTFQIAIVAKHLGVPYYVTGVPDTVHPTIGDVQIEFRDPSFVLEAMGVKTARDGVKGYYPAFDVTPPELVTGVVTDRGILSPYRLDAYGEKDAYEVVV
jgi:methylthioribose-1-phosphate isomerase